MNIEVNVNNNGENKIIDTNKISDRDAEIYEALDNLYKVCSRYNLLTFARVIPTKDTYVGATFIPSDIDNREAEADMLVNSIDAFVNSASGGQLRVVKKVD